VTYSGPVKPSVDKFVEIPFTSDQAELNVVKAGSSDLTVGYLPVPYLPQKAAIEADGYTTVNGYPFSINYFPLNLHNPTFGPVFQQLYFRQAFQHLIDQEGWTHAFTMDTASPTFGAVPVNPPNDFVNAAGKTDPYPFDIAAATKLLSEHGWKVKPDGTTTCQQAGVGPGDCGAGIPAGLGLSFNLDYQAGTVVLDQEMKDLKSRASQVGIDLQLTTHPFAQVQGAAVQCASTDSSCTWTAENWGGGWVFVPDYYPSGELLFATGALANQSNYSDPMADRLIAATTTAVAGDAQAALDAYADYIQTQLPVLFQPTQAGNPVADGPVLVATKLGGFSINAYTYITPETWYLKG